MSLTTPTITDQEIRRAQYNTWLESLSPYKIARLCHAPCPNDHSRSLEEWLNDEYEQGNITFAMLNVELALILA